MSAEFLNGLTDENPELQRQIGCMTGIFQMFDRQHLLTGRRLSAQSNKRLPSGHSLLTRSNLAAEVCSQSIREKNLNKNVNEDRRVSVESSRTSFSSSSYSSLSSVDGSKSTQQEPSSNDHSSYSDKSLNHPTNSRTSEIEGKLVHPHSHCDPVRTTTQSGRQSLDFRDVVKDSIYRDSHALSVKTSIKEETKRQTMKHKDSPRPFQLSKSIDGSHMTGVDGKSRTGDDVDESLRVLVKRRESPPFLSDANEPPRKSCEGRDGSLYPPPKETPRFSNDGKTSSKLRELPRLSLDSRSASLKSSSYDLKPNSVFKDLDRANMHRRISVSLDDQPALRSNACSPSVVVKLMGLEAMPNLRLGNQEQAHSKGNLKDRDQENLGTRELDQTAPSPGNSMKLPIAPRQKNPDPIMKPISNTRLPIDVAPWIQQDKIHNPQKTTYGYREYHMKQQPESVFSKIEKRMKDVEFQKANKDFRALKQILDSIQAKGLLESKRGEGQPSEALVCDVPPGKSKSFMPTNSDEFISQIFPTVKKVEKIGRAFNSPIVIMKPVKYVNSASMSPQVIPIEGLSSLQRLRTSDPAEKKKTLTVNKLAEDQTPKASSAARVSRPILAKDTKIRKEENYLLKTNLRASQMSSRTQEFPRENIGISMKTSTSPGLQSSPRENNGRTIRSSNSVSPRLQQRKLDLEKRSRPPLPTAESNKPQKQIPSRHTLESVSPRGRSKLKGSQAQQNYDQSSDISSETFSLGHQGDEISQRSDSNISLTSQVDIEAISVDSMEVKHPFLQQGCESPGRKAERNVASVLKSKQKSLHSPYKDASVVETATAAQEQPSPISVLDASFHQDSFSSPVKKHHLGLKGNENRTSNSNKSTSVSGISSSESKFNQKKLANIENLLQKLRQLSESNDEAPATDPITSLCKTQNPEDRYVSEILLASGLLMKDLTSEQLDATQIQLHPLGHPINPDLFLVLEQRKSSWLAETEALEERSLKFKSDTEKLHRKLVFDTVNELLIRKLDFSAPIVRTNSLLKTRNIKFPSGQRLLKELCSDIEQLRMDNSVAGGDSNAMCTADLRGRSEGWTDFVTELPVVVLEIERLIFKDLIDEVVNGEAATSFQGKAKARRRKLFDK